MSLLSESLLAAPVMRRGDYAYFVHPLTDGTPPLAPELLSEVAEEIKKTADCSVDYFLTMEAMGIHIAAVLGQLTQKPFSIVRKRQYGLPGEVVLDQSTGYSKGRMFVNGVKRGDRVTIVDAVISTGGTLIAVINALKNIGAEVVDAVCVIERGDGAARVKEATGVEVKTLARIKVTEGGVKIIE